jgi:hypothetical protein
MGLHSYTKSYCVMIVLEAVDYQMSVMNLPLKTVEDDRVVELKSWVPYVSFDNQLARLLLSKRSPALGLDYSVPI